MLLIQEMHLEHQENDTKQNAEGIWNCNFFFHTYTLMFKEGGGGGVDAITPEGFF